jgi:DNA-binding NtrC family response regulator
MYAFPFLDSAMTNVALSDFVVSRRSAASMSILIVDDEHTTRELCVAVAAQAGLNAIAVASAEQALIVLEQKSIDILLTDLKLPGMSGIDLLKRASELYPRISVIVLTQYGTIDSAIEAGRIGARDYITKPFRIEELRVRLDRAVQALDLQEENRLLREQMHTQVVYGSFIGASEKMRRVYRMIEKVGPRNYSVLILGESGTGKELVARAVHLASARKDRPFVPVDCSAITPTLIESELFGHVKGAFTGAMQSKQGLLETANGGTLFLDEIGEMPLDMQAKLLRALQEREIKPVGATERRQIDVRIIAATNRDLEAAIKAGAFRQDLYFRLNVVQIKLPPLRERRTDIPLLVASFLEKYAASDEPLPEISEEAMRALMGYDWPGNVRELENAVARAVAHTSSPLIHVGDLPSNLHYPSVEKTPLKDEILPLEELERRAILRTLQETSGDKVKASKMLGIGKTTLYRKLKQYKVPFSED